MISPFFPERNPNDMNFSEFKKNSEKPKESSESLDSKRKNEVNSSEVKSNIENTEKSEEGLENLDEKINVKKSNVLPRNGGEWSGVPGNSEWKPQDDIEPGDRNGTNPNNKSWAEIKEDYNFEAIPFNEGEPDFSEISKSNVEIDDFSGDRSSNFDQADEKAAEKRGCTPEEVAKWREENKYTWHECSDCRTMQKVPTEVHGNIPHSGGISEYKSQNRDM